MTSVIANNKNFMEIFARQKNDDRKEVLKCLGNDRLGY